MPSDKNPAGHSRQFQNGTNASLTPKPNLKFITKSFMQTLNTIVNTLGFFLVLLALNSIATGLLVAVQMLIAKVSPTKKYINQQNK